MTTDSETVDKVVIQCDPNLVPTDMLRMRALETNGFLLKELATGEIPLAWFDADSFRNYGFGRELADVASIRQFLVLGWLAMDDEVRTNINTGRLRIAAMSPSAVGGLLVETVDYNLGILVDDDNNNDGVPSSEKDNKLGKPVLVGIMSFANASGWRL